MANIATETKGWHQHEKDIIIFIPFISRQYCRIRSDTSDPRPQTGTTTPRKRTDTSTPPPGYWKLFRNQRMEKGGLAKRSSHPLGRYRGMESFRRRKHVLQYGKDRFRQRQHQTAIPHIHREKGDRLSFRPRLGHLRKQQCYLSSGRRQSGEVQPHRILHLSRLRRRAHRQHEPHVSQCRYSCQERI